MNGSHGWRTSTLAACYGTRVDRWGLESCCIDLLLGHSCCPQSSAQRDTESTLYNMARMLVGCMLPLLHSHSSVIHMLTTLCYRECVLRSSRCGSLDSPSWFRVSTGAAVSRIFSRRWRYHVRDGMLSEGHDVDGQEGRTSAQLGGYVEVSFTLPDTRMETN